MSDLSKRSFAPISGEAWEAIDSEAKRLITGQITARSIVDFNGPKGLRFSAVNLGRVRPESELESFKGLSWGLREVKPLLEFKVPCKLNLEELDNISRGNQTPDMEPLLVACSKAVLFEEKAVYFGLKEAGIEGIAEVSPHKPLVLGKEADKYVAIIEQAIVSLQKSRVGGPFHLVLGSIPYQIIQQGHHQGYPVIKRVRELLGSDIQWSPAIEGGVLLSGRGGDYELTVGQDFSIGYAGHNPKEIELFIGETFTFQVLEPAAAVLLNLE